MDIRSDWSRREVLAAGVAGLAVAAVPRLARAASEEDPALIVVYLRGGADALAFCPPVGDAGLERLRPGAGRGMTPVDGLFALPAPLAVLVRSGTLAVVQGVGLAGASRSHSVAQRQVELGRVDVDTDRPGWLGERLLRAGSGGRALAYTARASDALRGLEAGRVVMRREIAEHSLTEQILDAIGALRGDPTLGAAVIEQGGWDAHADAHGADASIAELSEAMTAAAGVLGSSRGRSVRVLVMTEFGRAVGLNALGGTDHGEASVALLLGADLPVRGVYHRWGGLAGLRASDALPVGVTLAEVLELTRERA